MDNIESLCCELISYVGAAKSAFIESVNLVEEKKFDEAKRILEEGDEFFVKGHEVHFKMLQLDSNDKLGKINLLALHAEDQLMAAEVVKVMAEKYIRLYQTIDD